MPERRAVDFARLAGRQLPVRVMVAKDGREPVEATRMLDVLKLDVLGGQEVLLSAEGEGAEAAAAWLAEVRLLLARHTMEDCRRLAAAALAAPDAATARRRVREAAPAATELGL